MPSQLPALPVSVSPRRAVPVTVGGATLRGPAASTGVVGSLASKIVASGLVAVTTTRTAASTSLTVRVYAAPIAPAMSTNPSPKSRCHW